MTTDPRVWLESLVIWLGGSDELETHLLITACCLLGSTSKPSEMRRLAQDRIDLGASPLAIRNERQ
jgi:hypothetical protein